jgi:hypothetical protein
VQILNPDDYEATDNKETNFRDLSRSGPETASSLQSFSRDQEMRHITLIGDSIFDNKTYVGEGRSVIEHLQAQKPNEWTVTLRAVDGSITTDVAAQVPKIPTDTTHIFLSVGGNDALTELSILEMKVSSSAEVFEKLYDVSANFEERYVKMLEKVLALGLPTTACTIYYPLFGDAHYQKLAVAALPAFNDVIIRQAISNRIPLIDLRILCNDAADYANPIEPSEIGGSKIARTILEITKEHDFAKQDRSVVYY